MLKKINSENFDAVYSIMEKSFPDNEYTVVKNTLYKQVYDFSPL